MNQIELDGKVAIVTGAAQGIGRAIAERLLNSGAQVWLWDRDEHVLAETVAQLGKNARSLCVDVSAFENVIAAVQTVADAAGQIDIMVNNAGISGVNTTVADYPVDEWQRVIEINLNGVFYGCKAVVPHMIARGYGRIVNMASVAGKEGNPNASAYSASKAGVIAPDQIARQGTGRARYCRKLRDTRSGTHRHLRSNDPGACGLHAVENSTRTICRSR